MAMKGNRPRLTTALEVNMVDFVGFFRPFFPPANQKILVLLDLWMEGETKQSSEVLE